MGFITVIAAVLSINVLQVPNVPLYSDEFVSLATLQLVQMHIVKSMYDIHLNTI